MVIHSFLPSKNVLRANVPSHFKFKWRQPFYTKIAICGHPPRGHDINLSRPPTNPYHLPEIAISWVGKIGFCILECRRSSFRWGFSASHEICSCMTNEAPFYFQDLPWFEQCHLGSEKYLISHVSLLNWNVFRRVNDTVDFFAPPSIVDYWADAEALPFFISRNSGSLSRVTVIAEVLLVRS